MCYKFCLSIRTTILDLYKNLCATPHHPILKTTTNPFVLTAEQAGVGIIFTVQGQEKNTAQSWYIIATNFPCRDGVHESK